MKSLRQVWAAAQRFPSNTASLRFGGQSPIETSPRTFSNRKPYYFTAPATALVKLFCRQKKMITVGSEQIVTPAMTTP